MQRGLLYGSPGNSWTDALFHLEKKSLVEEGATIPMQTAITRATTNSNATWATCAWVLTSPLPKWDSRQRTETCMVRCDRERELAVEEAMKRRTAIWKTRLTEGQRHRKQQREKKTWTRTLGWVTFSLFRYRLAPSIPNMICRRCVHLCRCQHKQASSFVQNSRTKFLLSSLMYSLDGWEPFWSVTPPCCRAIRFAENRQLTAKMDEKVKRRKLRTVMSTKAVLPIWNSSHFQALLLALPLVLTALYSNRAAAVVLSMSKKEAREEGHHEKKRAEEAQGFVKVVKIHVFVM